MKPKTVDGSTYDDCQNLVQRQGTLIVSFEKTLFFYQKLMDSVNSVNAGEI